MTTIIKSTIAVCGLLAAVLAPLTARADNFVFSGKGAFGEMYVGGDGTIFASGWAISSKSNKTNSSGAFFSGYSYSYPGTECLYGYGSTEIIQFNATGSIPKRVTASGDISVTWYDCNSSALVLTETMSFIMDLSARNQAVRRWGMTHVEEENTKTDHHYDEIYASAAVNASSISSLILGIMTPSSGAVGQSKVHDVSIAR